MEKARKKAKKSDKKRGGKRKKSDKYEKQTKAIIIFLFVVLASTLIFYESAKILRRFEYAGIQFEKKKEGTIDFYYTQFPVRDYSGNVLGYIPFALRNDPRELEYIGINDNIKLFKNYVIGMDPSLIHCEDVNIATASLVLFMNKAGINLVGKGSIEEGDAEKNNLTYISCGNSGTYVSTIILKQSDKSEINKQGGECYIVDIEDCDILNASERFIMGVYAHSQGIEI